MHITQQSEHRNDFWGNPGKTHGTKRGMDEELFQAGAGGPVEKPLLFRNLK
jgi:hypothetical protein